jgi:hypothetical protein
VNTLPPAKGRAVGDTLLLERLDIAGLVDRLIVDVRRGRMPGGAPYRHVNGFTKIVAAEHGDGSRLTLHYWAGEARGGEHVSRPHDHRFPFSSVLLGGRQHFVELEEVEQGEQWRRFTYRPYAGGRIAHVARAGTIGLDPVRVVERAPLQGQYVTTSTIVHQAVTDRRQACATLVLRGPRERLRSQVYYRPDEPPPRGGLQLGRRLDRAEVVRQLEDVAAMIA